jgi:hypothetical protein
VGFSLNKKKNRLILMFQLPYKRELKRQQRKKKREKKKSLTIINYWGLWMTRRQVGTLR